MLPAGEWAGKSSKETSTNRPSKTSSKSHSSKTGLKSRNVQSPPTEWSEWEWDPRGQREWRARPERNGEWEYQCRSPDIGETPRSYPDDDPPLRRENLSSTSDSQDATSGLGSSSYNSTTKTQKLDYSFERDSCGPPYDNSTYSPSIQPPQLISSPENGSYGYNIPFPQSSPSVEAFTTFDGPPQQPNHYIPSARSRQSSNPTKKSAPTFGARAPALEYGLITKPEGYFKPGRIFSTPWGEFETASNEGRTFVVMREGVDSSVCCVLLTSATGGFRSGNGSQNLALVFAAGRSPELLSGEKPPGMGEFPIIIENPFINIDLATRLDFSRVHTIEHNVKVRNVGRIDRNCLRNLRSAFLKAMGAKLSEDGNRQTAFGDQIAVEDEVTRPIEFTSNIFSTERVGSSFLGSVPQSSSPNDTTHGSPASSAFSSNEATLHGSFRVHHAKDFQLGKIFKILWSEPLGESMISRHKSNITLFGQPSYTSIRRFVITRPLTGHCICIPILTYNRQATSKSGVRPQDHAIIYTADKSEEPPKELGREEKLEKTPIRVSPNTARDRLDQTSRLNYAKIYTVEYNVKVCFIGTIHKKSVKYFLRDYNSTHTLLPEGDDIEDSE